MEVASTTGSRSGTMSETTRVENKKETVRYEIENGEYVGTVEWQGPGQVSFEVPDPSEREWFERYFGTEESVMGGAGERQGMTLEKRDASEAAFNRAAWELCAYSYKVRQGDGMRGSAHRNGRM